ncbi:MAG TPA: beta-galactosidase GalB [Phycisphaerae bacterium]|jgi:beta-galactosidase
MPKIHCLAFRLSGVALFSLACAGPAPVFAADPRSRTLITDSWRFTKNDPPNTSLLYDVRPAAAPAGRGATTPPPVPAAPTAFGPPVKPWIIATGNAFLKDPASGPKRPPGNLGADVPYVSPTFDDSAWQSVNLPHDFAIEGPFITTGGGGMGRLPTTAIAWYRKDLSLPASDAGKSIFLDIDGAMSYSEVWLNGQFVGGWPFGYASFRLDLTPYAKPGQKNSLAIRLDNPPASSRWYPGAGIYRNVWLVETNPVHVAQYGTYITTPDASPTSATVNLNLTVDNDSASDSTITASTEIFEIDRDDHRVGAPVQTIAPATLQVPSKKSASVQTKTTLSNPKLWGTGGMQKPNRYLALTTLQQNGQTIDTYETTFGVRTLKYDSNAGLFLNGQHVKINGVCDHHDLGALGTAINTRALQRQLELLSETGCNALRTSHNPPAPELLELCDKMGILVMDESFDCWSRQKTADDYHLLFADWHEKDLRAMLRRDRNHPSIILWSIGNEVGEQMAQGPEPANIAKELTQICHEEDPTRPTISAMNSARSTTPMVAAIDAIGLNYQGAGLNSSNPQYPVFHQAFPDKFILGSENEDAYSSRGYYTFPLPTGRGGANANSGAQSASHQISSYDLYHANWSYTPDYEFAAQDRYPFVAGEFVWTGFDYIGEPDPFSSTSRSSYCGILDLAGFKKDRFYLYQAYWRPDFPMAHILPHWNWPDRAADSTANPPRAAQVTPVHVYTSGDEAELFLNGTSLGRKQKAKGEYRLRWDDVTYAPGELKVVAYKNGKEWATDSVKTAGAAAKITLSADRAAIAADGKDLSFVTLTITDKDGIPVPQTNVLIHFSLTGPGEIVATDNGDPSDLTPFPSKDRKTFDTLALAIIRSKTSSPGVLTLTAKSENLPDAMLTIATK